MSPDKYERIVRRAALSALAEEEGRLRASAEGWESGAERMRADLEALAIPAQRREQMEAEVARLLGQARAARAEADGLRARAARVAGWVRAGNVSRPEAPPEHDAADAALTLRKAAETGGMDPNGQGGRLAAALACLEKPEPSAEDLRTALVFLTPVEWPSGLPAAYAGEAVRVLERLAARATLP